MAERLAAASPIACARRNSVHSGSPADVLFVFVFLVDPEGILVWRVWPWCGPGGVGRMVWGGRRVVSIESGIESLYVDLRLCVKNR